MGSTVNPLLSSQKPSDSGLQVALHPLVLLTISDYITRHTLREQPGPIIGALLGQQNGREVTIEHAFECNTLTNDDGQVSLDATWFSSRLDQMKTIHSSPQLELVGWYTLLPKSGPIPSILPIHNWILSEHNESSLLLGFHPEESLKHDAGSRLPLTIYESNYEAEESRGEKGEDEEMRDGDPPLKLRFRELPYSIETGEAEMISMDFVAKGAGNATAVKTTEQNPTTTAKVAEDIKGKRKMETLGAAVAAIHEAKRKEQQHVLSREDEEMIAAITAKANSVKMLQARIDLLATYLERLPASYLTDDNTAMITGEGSTTPSHTILRSIQALVNRLSLVVPSATEAYNLEMLREVNDVRAMTLLDTLLESVSEARSVGKKFSIVENSQEMKDKTLAMDKRLTTLYEG
ncbi:COP9 signalosome-like protein subunit 6 [Poronia punctata]|nr:COP9 signalosome-like protein subunit 6 [Poronia punctata]